MNYIILNDREIFENQIHIDGFKEVELNGNDRVDAVFCHITKEILENINKEPERRDSILPQSWLLRDAGIFVLSKIDRNILYDEDTELIQTMFGLFDQESFYIEIRGFNRAESYNQIDQFIIAYKKSLGYIEDLFPEKIDSTENIQELLKYIEKKIL